MYILGIYNGHNATASLMQDGKIIAVASEERFTGIKNFLGFPKHAIDYVLSQAGITSKQIDLVAIPFQYGAPIHASFGTKKKPLVSALVVLYIPVNIVRRFWGFLVFKVPRVRIVGRMFYVLAAKTIGKFTVDREREFLANYLGIEKKQILAFDHHLSHAASAYYASPFNTKKVLVLTIDGEGDTFSASVNIFDGDSITTISRTPRENSLGFMYAGLTTYLGMKANEHEYKVMGLAPYAKSYDVDKVYKEIEHIVRVNKETMVFETSFNTQNMEQFLKTHLAHVRFDILAGAFQKLIEEKMTEWVRASIKKTGIHTLALAGGVFMNVKANQKVAELREVKELFIIPSCGDESCMLGASYLAYQKACQSSGIKMKYFPIQDIYWGKGFTNKEVEEVLSKLQIHKKYTVKRMRNIEQHIANLLANGNVVARCRGRMEFGARALGNRSILADPRNFEVVRLINEAVKNRDFWMPFAPSILYERAEDYILQHKKLEPYYMMMTFDTTEKGRKELKAAMHPYDFTVRPQLVREEFNPKYYRLIREFEKLTGVGGVLNTSFNLHGYPIVLGPQEALYAFQHSGLRYLALEDYLVTKK